MCMTVTVWIIHTVGFPFRRVWQHLEWAPFFVACAFLRLNSMVRCQFVAAAAYFHHLFPHPDRPRSHQLFHDNKRCGFRSLWRTTSPFKKPSKSSYLGVSF